MKKFLLLIEDNELWGNFKNSINTDINSAIMELIRQYVRKKGGNSK